MDKELIAQRFSKAASTYNSEAVAQQQVAQRLVELLAGYVNTTSIKKVLEIGCGTGLFTQRLTELISAKEVFLNDLYDPDIRPHCTEFIVGDAEDLRTPLPGGLDMVASCSAVQWFNSPQSTYKRLATLLKSGGVLAIATYTAQNLPEIKNLTGTTLPYLSAQEISELLNTDFRVSCCVSEQIELQFPSPIDALKHLKLTGTNAINSTTWTKSTLATFTKEYLVRFPAKPSGVTLTYYPLYIIAHRR